MTRRSTALFQSRRRGFSLLELLIVLAVVGIIVVIAVARYERAVVRAHEARALANLRTIVHAEFMFYSGRQRFGTFQQLITETQFLPDAFERQIKGTGGSETIASGRYEYDLRFDRDAVGFTLDVDPKTAYTRKQRRFRYRLRDVRNSRVGVILVAPPSEKSPSEREYELLQTF